VSVAYNSSMPRQRIFPIGTTASERVEASLKALVERGGARKTFRLKPEANKALQQLQRMLDTTTETEAVEIAILTMRDSLKGAVAAVIKKPQADRAKDAAKKAHLTSVK
jgi:hypothetical protein